MKLRTISMVLAAAAVLALGLPAPGQGPLSGPVAVQAAAGAITGKVEETMNAGGYTYMLIKQGDASTWVAVPEVEVRVGQEVSVAPGMEMKNYTSKTLNRTFDSVIFSSGMAGGAGAGHGGPSPHGGMAGGSPHGGMGGMMGGQGGVAGLGTSTGSVGAIVPSAEIEVAKAQGENAYTVGEIFARRKQLDGTTVRVRGQVMKVSTMIMGRNWVHLQDGTGDTLKNSHDLVFTTTEMPEKGKVVTMEGVLHADRDFGAGYRYDAIVEDAKVVGD